ncbi:MAG: glycosyltransferase family 39 protein, partial [Patescibacteria group bacterium]
MRYQLFAVALAANIIATGLYYWQGYGGYVVFFWLLSLGIAGYWFRHRTRDTRVVKESKKHDYYILALLLLLFVPIYFISLYTIPFQVNTDEVTISFFARMLSADPHADIFALSDYFYFPSMIFILWGWLADILGGVSLMSIRILHATSGIGIIIAAYFLFKFLFGSRWYGFIGAVILGANHALIALSRMAMRDNVALLVETAGLALLVRGWQKKSYYHTFLGGAVAGFGFYNYFPARATILIWGLFLFLLLVFYRRRVWEWDLLRLAGACMLGFFMMIAPLVIATLNTPGFGARYAREQILIYPEGRELERMWEGAATAREAYVINLKNGLLALNTAIHDHGYIYPNYGHGFLDPVTGGLVWLGLAAYAVRRGKRPEELLILAGFFSLYLGSAFLLTKNPNYTRYLMLLPFVVGMALMALRSIREVLNRIRPRLGAIIMAGGVVFILVSNLFIFGDYIIVGAKDGNDVGGTGRYIEARAHEPAYSFYLVSDSMHTYYSWGAEEQWKSWMKFFANPAHQVYVVPPTLFMNMLGTPPFTVFVHQNFLRSA